jgi:hypothetical protein
MLTPPVTIDEIAVEIVMARLTVFATAFRLLPHGGCRTPLPFHFVGRFVGLPLRRVVGSACA